MQNEAAVDSAKISDGKASIVFRLTDILPGPKVKRVGGVLILNTSPPEFFDDRINFFNERFGEEDS